ncbi:MAG: DNA polymerase III subunit delta, partial [Novosphingobium sp.]
RGDIGPFIEAETAARRIFFKDKGDIARQLQKWRGPRLSRLVDKLVALHRALLGNSQQAELLLAQGLTEIARFAAPRK